MSIRNKLLFVVFFVIASFGVSTSIYFLIRSPLARISAEQQILSGLRISFLDETVQLNRLASAPFHKQLDAFQAATRATTEEFKKTDTITLLPRLIPSIKKSLQTIRDLKAVHDQAVSNFVFTTMNIENDAKEMNMGEISFSVFALATRTSANDPMSGAVVGDVQELLTGLAKLTGIMEKSVTTIQEQNSTIAGAVLQVQRRANLVALIIAFGMLAITLVVTLILTSRISRSILTIERNISVMGSGDLTVEFSVQTRDEIGTLSSNLSSVTQSLRESINNAQQVSNENVQMKESLVVAAEQASASTNQINANLSSINNQISSMDENVSRSTDSVQNITRSIQALNDEIQEQMAMVEESSAAVTQMIASIDSLSIIADRRRGATEELVGTVARGGDKMAATFDMVNQINESVDNIKDITGIIESIAAQTNLLAMNAAIEAAHAGSAGRGFSVVAEEIRKLAEAASENSQQIGRILKDIVARIDEAGSSGQTMNTAFQEIDREARELAKSLSEIFSSMNELRAGGDQIRQAMAVLQTVSTHVKDGSVTINNNSAEIRDTMTTVREVSAQVRSGMSEISAGMSEIATTVTNVNDIAEHLGELGESLNRSLTGFKT